MRIGILLSGISVLSIASLAMGEGEVSGTGVAQIGIPHQRNGRERMVEEKITVYLKPEQLKNFDPGQDKTYRANAMRTGAFTCAGPKGFNKVRWRFGTGGAVKSSPVVVDGVVYVGGGGGFYALAADTGKPLWQFPIKGGADGAAAITDGVVIFAANDSMLYGLDAKTGAKLWANAIEKSGNYGIGSCPVVGFGVVFGPGPKTITGYEIRTGKVIWESECNNAMGRSAPALDGNRLFLISGGSKWSYLFNPELTTGRPITKQGMIAGEYHTPVLTERGIYLTDSDSVFLLNAADPGKYKWKQHLDLNVGTNQKRVNTSPAVWDDIVIVGMDMGKVFAFNGAKGEPIWTFNGKEPFRSSPSISEATGLVYFGGNDGNFYALDARKGTKVGEQAIGAPIDTSPFLAGGAVFFGCDDGNVYAIE